MKYSIIAIQIHKTTLMASALLVSKLRSFDKNSIIISLESTAHYMRDNLVRYLVAEFYQVCVLNPIKTCQMRKNNVRKTKTDKVDTFVIAKTLMMQDDLKDLLPSLISI